MANIKTFDLGSVITTSSDRQSASEILASHSNFQVGARDNDGEIVVVFRAALGKGSGLQIVPAKEIAEFTRTLEELVEGSSDTQTAGYVPSYVRLRQTFKRVENPGQQYNKGGQPIPLAFEGQDWYEWNHATGNGTESKGAKPVKIAVSEMPEFMTLFRGKVNQALAALRARGLLAEEVDLADLVAETAAEMGGDDGDDGTDGE